MVADRVTVLSRRGRGQRSEGVKWETDGQGEFTVEPYDKADARHRCDPAPARGRQGVPHVLAAARDRQAVLRLHRSSDRHGRREGEGRARRRPRRRRSTPARRSGCGRKIEVKPEEYTAFYKQISRDIDDPLKTIHIAAEGAMEFRALLFLPHQRGMDWMAGPEKKSWLDLYVRRVLIQHECEQVVPPYLRFVKGVVDSADLPLNVSRETLQHNPLLAKIKSNVINRVLKTLEEMKESEYETYLKFYKEFGALPEGRGRRRTGPTASGWPTCCCSNRPRPSRANTPRWPSTSRRCRPEQKEIYYLIGENRAHDRELAVPGSVQGAGQEVLLLTDPVDEYLVASLHAYKDKPLKAADRGEVREDKEAEEKRKAEAEQFKALLEVLKAQAAGSEGRPALDPAEGKRRLPGGRRGGDGRPHGAAAAADGPRRRGRCVKAHPGNQSRSSRGADAAKAGGSESRRSARGRITPGSFTTRRWSPRARACRIPPPSPGGSTTSSAREFNGFVAVRRGRSVSSSSGFVVRALARIFVRSAGFSSYLLFWSPERIRAEARTTNADRAEARTTNLKRWWSSETHADGRPGFFASAGIDRPGAAGGANGFKAAPLSARRSKRLASIVCRVAGHSSRPATCLSSITRACCRPDSCCVSPAAGRSKHCFSRSAGRGNGACS